MRARFIWILIRFILFTLQMKEEYKSLVEELNKLSEDFPATKDRMVEIAKILLTDHYKYLPRNKNKWNNAKDAEKSSQQNDQKNTA